MNTELFFEWLARFSMFIQKTKDRKFALLLNNASCDGSLESILKLQNVAVIYLPANTTSLLQPLGAGIIAAVKRMYRKW